MAPGLARQRCGAPLWVPGKRVQAALGLAREAAERLRGGAGAPQRLFHALLRPFSCSLLFFEGFFTCFPTESNQFLSVIRFDEAWGRHLCVEVGSAAETSWRKWIARGPRVSPSCPRTATRLGNPLSEVFESYFNAILKLF